MKRRAPLLALLSASLLAQLPLLLRPEVNSDNAVVGLQAIHLLSGELSPWGWGTPYRSSIDAVLTAVAFLFIGSRPLALVLVPVAGHLLLVAIAYRLLHRHLPSWSAAACCTPLVFLTLGPLLAIFSGTREWSIVAALLALLLLDQGALAAGLALAMLAALLDLYAVVFLPAALVLAALAARDGRPTHAVLLRRLAGGLLAAAVSGALLLVARAHAPPSAAGHVDPGRLGKNLATLWHNAGPALLGFERLERPVLQIGGALLLGALFLFGAFSGLAGGVPWKLQRLALAGAVCVATTLLAFLGAAAVLDRPEASRYLAAMIWCAPLWLSPAAARLGARRTFALLLPFAVSAALVEVRMSGLSPAYRPALPPGASDLLLRDALRERSVTAGVAPYWQAYRLGFLFDENPALMPDALAEDRYPPYRERFAAAPVVAYLFADSGEAAEAERRFLAQGVPLERVEAGGRTALVIRRAAAR